MSIDELPEMQILRLVPNEHGKRISTPVTPASCYETQRALLFIALEVTADEGSTYHVIAHEQHQYHPFINREFRAQWQPDLGECSVRVDGGGRIKFSKDQIGVENNSVHFGRYDPSQVEPIIRGYVERFMPNRVNSLHFENGLKFS